jgi:DNA-directed RNA polymerase specialized sigma24 family protein
MTLLPLEWRALFAQVLALIERLPQRQSETLLLKARGHDYHEIAESMGVAYDTAKANYRHGILKVRAQILPAHGPEEER